MPKFLPGNKVIITQNGWHQYDTRYHLVAIKGSIARIISIEEYEAAYPSINPDVSFRLEFEKKWVQEGSHYPVIFETVEYDDEDTGVCKVGLMIVLNERFFLKID